MMIVYKGELVHVISRRLRDSEPKRHFVGQVMEVSEAIVRLQGNVFVFDSTRNEFIKKSETRTTIIDLAESGYIVNILPDSVKIEELEYSHNKDRLLVMTDGKAFSLDISEFGLVR